MSSAESVKLVIWDLDETFWRGTLSEGGVREHITQHEEIVVELSRRGILNSICSKNNFEVVKRILEERKIWQYFVFPSIEWSSKGRRVHSIIDIAQLRQQNVMFIDDNPQNLAEVQRSNPLIQTATPDIIPILLADLRLRGKEDHDLTRLKQYKILERRQNDFGTAIKSGHSVEFLRSCNIKISINYDLEANIDRIIELINRTNQLNFTKIRLDENNAKSAFREKYLTSGRQLYFHGGIIRVKDRYGDYGFCGFYMVSGNEQKWKLIHYLFSCRILGMGVETWLYNKLGRPEINLRGEILSDPTEVVNVDWIRLVENDEHVETQANKYDVRLENAQIRIAGGCNLDPIAHYIRMYSSDIVSSTSRARGGVFLRQDFSSFILLKHFGAELEPLKRIGYVDEDLIDSFLAPSARNCLLICGLASDVHGGIFRSKETGVEASIVIDGFPKNLTSVNSETLEQWRNENGKNSNYDHIKSIIDELKTNWTFSGVGIGTEKMHQNIESIHGRMPNSACLVIVMQATKKFIDGEWKALSHARGQNDAIINSTQGLGNVFIVSADDYISAPEDVIDGWGTHYRREVYARMANAIAEIGARFFAATARSPALE